MQLDDDVCLCFHVSRRKVEQFVRVKRPEVASQLSECFGAGTGCGWCRPFLKRLFQSAGSAVESLPEELPSASEYANSREVYRQDRASAPRDEKS